MIYNEVPKHESSSKVDQLDRQVFGWATSAFTCQNKLSSSLTVIMHYAKRQGSYFMGVICAPQTTHMYVFLLDPSVLYFKHFEKSVNPVNL